MTFEIGGRVVVTNPNTFSCGKVCTVVSVHGTSSCSLVPDGVNTRGLLFENWEIKKLGEVDKAIQMLENIGYKVTKTS